MNSDYVEQVVNLRRIGNPPAEVPCKSSGVFGRSAGRIGNPPQIANLHHEGQRGRGAS